MLKQLTKRIVDRVEAWRFAHADNPAFFYVTAVCIGIVSGAAAAALKSGIEGVKDWVFGSFNIHAGNWVVLLLPLVGIYIAVLFARYIVKQPMDHATERITTDLSQSRSYLSPRLIWGSIVSCSFTLGLGGSAGAESPIAYTGAAVGSNIGRVFRLPKENVLQLVGCGAAAGIAGIYMAPIGGVMFAIECLRMRQNLQTVLALTFSSLAAALTCYILRGCNTDVSFVPEMRFDLHLIPHVLICGAICGLYSLYYIKMLQWYRKYLRRATNVWLKALYGGLTLSALLYLFPTLYGEGYDTIGQLMSGNSMYIASYSPLYGLGKHFGLLIVLFVALLLVKPIALSATNDSGGVGGEFTPTFFCGAVLGFLFAMVCNHYLHMHLPYALFAFFGMAAVMSGAQHAPLMAIFIASEMTGMYGFILPLTLAALASFVMTAFIDRQQIPQLLGTLPPATEPTPEASPAEANKAPEPPTSPNQP